MEIEGVRKYHLKHLSISLDSELNLDELIAVREELYMKKFIGEDAFGIGYGNLSERLKDNPTQFVITGTQTGNKQKLERVDFSIIKTYSFEKFYLESYGLIFPSSESLTHAAIYETFPQVNAIIHIHSEELWNFMLEKNLLRTEKVEYGTREMIKEVQRIYANQKFNNGSLFVMAGHTGGIISFGKTLENANSILNSLYANIEKIP